MSEKLVKITIKKPSMNQGEYYIGKNILELLNSAKDGDVVKFNGLMYYSKNGDATYRRLELKGLSGVIVNEMVEPNDIPGYKDIE